MKAIIMAGGEGSRLRPLTCDRPKPMVPLLNRPVMEYAIGLLRDHGIREIGVTLHYMPDAIRDHFGDGSPWGVRLRYFQERVPLGTAGSVKNTGDFLDETFIVISGDALTDFDLTQAIAYHRKKRSMATLVLTSVEDPLEYGVVMINGEGRIERFLEKPSWGEVFSDRVNTGIYILEREILDLIPHDEPFDFAKDLFPLLMGQGVALYGYKAEGYWCDIGNHQQYRHALRDFLTGKVRLPIPADESYPGIWMEEGALLAPGVVLEGPAYIGRGAFIESGARIGPNTVIGRGAYVERKASIIEGAVWDRCAIGPGAAVQGAVLCEGVRVGAAVRINEGVVVGDRCILKDGAVLKNQVHLWPEKTVEEGRVVADHIIFGRNAARRLFGTRGISGDLGREITPELTAKLGAALGSLLSPQDSVCISHDLTPAGSLLARALGSGIQGTGATLLDAGVLTAPTARFAVSHLNARCGVHVRSHEGRVVLEFFDEKGRNLSKSMERKLENLMFREDFRRVGKEGVGAYKPVDGLSEAHREQLLSRVNQGDIRKKGFAVALAGPGPILEHWVTPLFRELGCRIHQRALETMDHGRTVWQPGAIAFVFDAHGEIIALYDEKGRRVSDDRMVILAQLIFVEQGERSLAVPVHAPAVLDDMAKKRGIGIRRVPTWPQAVQEAAPRALIHHDALAFGAHLLELLAKRDLALSGVMDSLPVYYRREKEVYCPWEAKGKVMRRLAEGEEEGKLLVDGIRVHRGNGVAMVIPDGEKPLYHIVGEGPSMEVAQELCDFYAEKINSLLADPNP